MAVDDKEKNTSKGNRIYFLDNLRTSIIFLVVLYHVGGVYESSGLWASFWIVDDPATNDLAGILNILIDIFVMPTLFFISGYLTPMSLKKNNGRAFLKARFKRLMIPWLIAVLTLIPLYKAIFLYARNLPQESWMTYFHFSNGNISSQNWLWFLPIFLLIPFIAPAGFMLSPVADRLVYWLSFYLSLLCLLYLTIETFRRYLDKPGKIWHELNRNSYYVYLIHVIVLGGIALLLLNSAMPSLLKYLTLTVSTIMASNLIISLYRQAVTGNKAINQPKFGSSSR